MDADRPLLDPDSLVDLLPIHPLQSDFPICTTRILLFKITTFCPNMTQNSTAASDLEAAVFLSRKDEYKFRYPN
jgi:hypothetical protein